MTIFLNAWKEDARMSSKEDVEIYENLKHGLRLVSPRPGLTFLEICKPVQVKLDYEPPDALAASIIQRMKVVYAKAFSYEQ